MVTFAKGPEIARDVRDFFEQVRCDGAVLELDGELQATELKRAAHHRLDHRTTARP
jgi:hypothetical protein